MRRYKFNLFVMCATCIVFAVLLGSGINIGFIVDEWFSPVFGYGSTIGAIVAVLSGLLVGMGAYGLFIHSERALKTILRLPDPERLVRGLSLVLLNAGFVALGIAGLLYRLTFLNSRGVGFLVVIGCILEISTPIFGIVMHPLSNPDPGVLEDERMSDFERNTVDEVWDAARALPAPDRMRSLGTDYEDIVDAAADTMEVKEKPQRPTRRPGPLTRRMHASEHATQPLPASTNEGDGTESIQHFPRGLQNNKSAQR